MKKRFSLILFLIVFLVPITAQRSKNTFNNPNPTRYMVGGTAFQLNGGEFLFKSTMFVVNSLTYGLTDHFSIGAGTELYTTFSDQSRLQLPNLYFVNAKAGFPIAHNLWVAAGIEGILFREHFLADDSFEGLSSIGLGYGLLTYGTSNKNVTLGVYVPTVNWNSMDKVPIFNLGGILRIGRKVAIIAESWLPADNVMIVGGGFRVFEQKAALDLGLLYVDGYGFPIPNIDYSLKF